MIPSRVFTDRRDQTRAELRRRSVASLPFVVSNLSNVAYLTGLQSSNASVLIHPDGDDVLCTDSRYLQAARDLEGDVRVLEHRACTVALVRDAVGGGFTDVAVEDCLPGAVITQLDTAARIVQCTHLVERLRMVKDAFELALLAKACRITGEAFATLPSVIRLGQSEAEIARRIELLFTELGADDRAFPSIVAAGAHSALPHHASGRYTPRPGDLLIVDAGAKVGGYHADMTRTYVVAAEPSVEQRMWCDVVQGARSAALGQCRAGQAVAGMDHASRACLTTSGFGEAMHHGLGHGIGLDIHESPMLTVRTALDRQRDGDRLLDNMVIAVEPGVYFPGIGGIRIEDSCIVRESAPEILTRDDRAEVVRDLQTVGEPC